ncbi:hypothetical protein ACJMK2_011718 [Sinanodonta woodiana]|uniref:Methyltransferase type 11 domain-containing protein n=1 Tax=Sinanodonta woodiana TaxID=1069815 RepID=A0ABD3V5W5_SINWO
MCHTRKHMEFCLTVVFSHARRTFVTTSIFTKVALTENKFTFSSRKNFDRNFLLNSASTQRNFLLRSASTNSALRLQRNLHTSKDNMACRYFEENNHTKAYALYRPTYPESVYDAILKYCHQSSGLGETALDLAVDVGCGSGQSTLPLGKYFKKVIGLDISQEQIKYAPTNMSNVSFQVGPSEDLSFLKNDTVDLITVAQALHWMDLDKFYSELQRTLKPGGVFVAYGYGNNILDIPDADALQSQFYSGTLNGHWDPKRHHIDDHYLRFSLPFPGWKRDDSHVIDKEMTVDEYIGYLSTWSGWQKYLKDNPDTDALNQLKRNLKKIYEEDLRPDQKVVRVKWPMFMLMGSKPR